MAAGEVKVEEIAGDKDIDLYAGQISISSARPWDYRSVDLSVDIGEVKAPAYGADRGGFFPSFTKKTVDGEYGLHAHVITGEIDLLGTSARRSRITSEEPSAVPSPLPGSLARCPKVKSLLTEKTPLMPTIPACQLFQCRTQCRTIFGKGVRRAQHILAMHLSLHDAGTLKLAELRSKHFLRDFRDAPLQLTVAYLARLELPKISGFHFPPITSIATVTGHSVRSMNTTYRMRRRGRVRNKKVRN